MKRSSTSTPASTFAAANSELVYLQDEVDCMKEQLGVIPAFQSAAEQLIKTSGLSAVDFISKALAKASVCTDNFPNFHFTCPYFIDLTETTGLMQGFVFGILRRFSPDNQVEATKGLSLTADGRGAVFDVPTAYLDAYLAGQENATNVSIEVLKEFPKLQEKEGNNNRFRVGGVALASTCVPAKFPGKYFTCILARFPCILTVREHTLMQLCYLNDALLIRKAGEQSSHKVP
ncbi:DEAD-box ATP-dependent RNA helicase 7-like [Papaver somniferum]|uniref:DEAD-box ATP-dependent RNA helicase 7-like n=1 Tax=Papaver somniferum TaxID=3469 RepID=UPI000E7008FC|nr:DEAD-box ATP-dependent RNA helicase 7-like [Papaver somniferum]